MSNITNKIEIFQNEVKRRLTTDFDNEWKPLWSYFEMTQQLYHGFFFIFLIKGGFGNRRVIFREWKYSHVDPLSSGLYNLDSITIGEEILNTSLLRLFEIQNLFSKSPQTIPASEITLDGHFKEIQDYRVNTKLNWNSDNEMDDVLKELVYNIKDLKEYSDTFK